MYSTNGGIFGERRRMNLSAEEMAKSCIYRKIKIGGWKSHAAWKTEKHVSGRSRRLS